MSEQRLEQEEHFTIQQLMDLVGKNASAINENNSQIDTIAKQITAVDGRVAGMERSMNVMQKSVADIREDIKDIKENEEITYPQQENIRCAVKKRVYELLELPLDPAVKWNVENRVIAAKYRKLFFRRCYSDVQKLGHLRQPYRMTAKKDYDAAMSEIEAWRPKDGVEGLKREADDIATANKIAREQGYMSRKAH